jgi:arsenate reductase
MIAPSKLEDAMTAVTIYHNTACATSRKVLAVLRDAGLQPRVIEYLKTPPTRAELQGLANRMGLNPRQLLRKNGKLFAELALDDPATSDDKVLDAIVAHPVLLERPIVVSARGAAICRPVDRVAALLP